MSFVRIKEFDGRTYSYLVESKREGPTVRQIHLKYLGVGDMRGKGRSVKSSPNPKGRKGSKSSVVKASKKGGFDWVIYKKDGSVYDKGHETTKNEADLMVRHHKEDLKEEQEGKKYSGRKVGTTNQKYTIRKKSDGSYYWAVYKPDGSIYDSGTAGSKKDGMSLIRHHQDDLKEERIAEAMKHKDNPGAGAKKRKDMNLSKEEKFEVVMNEYKQGTLRSGSNGEVVTDRKQAIAIALSESGQSRRQKKK